jgi:hypothetical protein
VNGPSAPATSKSLNAPLCLVVKGVTADGAMDDTADIPAAHDGITPPDSSILPGCSKLNGLSISVTANRGGNGAGLGFWLGRASGGRRRAWVVDPSDYPHLGCPILPTRRL